MNLSNTYNKYRRLLQIDRSKAAIVRMSKRHKPSLPSAIEHEYERRLANVVSGWSQRVNEVLLPKLERFTAEAYRFRSDDWNQDFTEVMTMLEVSLHKERPTWEIMARDIGQHTSDWNDEQWKKTMRSVLGINLYQTEPYLIGLLNTFTHVNVNLIKKLADETNADIHRIVSQGILQGKRHETIRKEIMSGTKLEAGRFKKTLSRAKLIARDQVSKFNGQLTKFRQTEIGIQEYFWHSSLDERVRRSHEAMDGLLCRWDDPTVYKISIDDTKWRKRSSIGAVEQHVGQDYQCRCTAAANFVGLLDI